jgi:hypothetical protein
MCKDETGRPRRRFETYGTPPLRHPTSPYDIAEPNDTRERRQHTYTTCVTPPPPKTSFIRDVHLECSNLRRRHTPTSCGHDERVVDAPDNEIRSTEADNHPPLSIPPITPDPAPEWSTLRRKFVSVTHGCDAWVFSTPDDGLRGTVGGYPSPALQIPSTRPRLMSRGPPFHQ